MDDFSFKKALNHFGINKDEFMAICKKYEYNQITIEEYYAQEKIIPEIEKWLSEHEDNMVIMKLKDKVYYSHINGCDEDCKEIKVGNVYNYYSQKTRICYEPDLFYDWGEQRVELTEHEVDFLNVGELVFEDHRGNEVKKLFVDELKTNIL